MSKKPILEVTQSKSHTDSDVTQLNKVQVRSWRTRTYWWDVGYWNQAYMEKDWEHGVDGMLRCTLTRKHLVAQCYNIKRARGYSKIKTPVSIRAICQPWLKSVVELKQMMPSHLHYWQMHYWAEEEHHGWTPKVATQPRAWLSELADKVLSEEILPDMNTALFIISLKPMSSWTPQ